MLALFALLWSGFQAWQEQQTRDFPLDVDGWAKVTHSGYSDEEIIEQLVVNPSMWKGPIVPTVYGLSHILVKTIYTPIGVNLLAFALSVGILHQLMLRYGGQPWPALLAMLGWIVYPPFRQLYGYYFAEPLIALFSTGLFALTLTRSHRPLWIGLCAGIVLLARSPLLLVILGLPWVVPMPEGSRRWRWLLHFYLGAAITFAPWGLRNLIVTGSYIPFTAEGGLTMYHGTHLQGESLHWDKLLQQPKVAELATDAPTDAEPAAKMHYWSDLAKEQVRADLLGQILHGVRKAVRFWMNVPDGAWLPTWKSALPMLLILPLGFTVMVRDRRHPLVRLMTLWIIGLWIMHAAVFGLLRYNFPIFGMMLFLALSSYWRPGHPSAPAQMRLTND